MTSTKCPHGYFTHSSQGCPWCAGYAAPWWRTVIPVVGHGNGWLLRAGEPICTSCGGPSWAGWGIADAGKGPQPPPAMCYGCRSGDNTRETIDRRARHEAARGVKKVR